MLKDIFPLLFILPHYHKRTRKEKRRVFTLDIIRIMMSQVSVCKIDMIHTQSVHMSLPSLCETSLKCYLPLLSWGEGFNVSVLVKQVLP